MKLEITIKDLLYPTLEEISSREGLSSEQYAANIVESFLSRQYRGSVIDKIKLAPVEELKTIKDNKLTDLETKKLSIK